MTTCSHLDTIEFGRPATRTAESVCEDCVEEGSRWVHLRACAECGRIGCCDSSPRQHASRHAATAAHPIAWSIEHGETWGWCYVDEVGFDIAGDGG